MIAFSMAPADLCTSITLLVSYQIAHSPDHRFYWWSDMTADELLLFIGFDEGKGPTSAVPHTAFQDPTCPADAAPRESIEARAYVFIDD